MFVSVKPGDEKKLSPGRPQKLFFCLYNRCTVTSANVYTLAHLGRKMYRGLNLNLRKHTLMYNYIFRYN